MANATTYETGTATNVHNVLQKLETFAIAEGWTINKSCLSDAIADIDASVDDSLQSGFIGAATSPWVSNHEDMATITDSLIEFTVDKGNDYYVQLNGFTEGKRYEVEFEVVDQTIGTLNLMFGEVIARYSSSDRRVHRFIYDMSAGGYIRFITNDFLGSFRVLSIKERIPSVDLSLSKSGVGFFNFHSDISDVQDRTKHKGPFIRSAASNAYTPGVEYDAHPGTSPISQTNSIDDYHGNGIFGYHFFGTSRHIYAVIEVRQGEFAHFGFGMSKKYFDFRGGNFNYGTNWLWDGYCNQTDIDRHSYPMGFYHYYDFFNYYRADLLGNTLDSWLKEGQYYDANLGYSYLWGTYNGHTNLEYKENPYYGTSPLSPIFFAGEDINKYRYSLGEMEEYRKIFCQYIDPKTVLSINGEDWMVFPIKRKQLSTPEEYVPNSGNYALAYYKGPSA